MKCFVTACDTYLGALLSSLLMEKGNSVVGGLQDPIKGIRPKGIQIIPEEDFINAALTSEAIFYDCHNEQSLETCLAIVRQLAARSDDFDEPKTFVAISNVLTWAKTKAPDPEDPTIPLNESEYRRRRAHPEAKQFLTAEKAVTKAQTDNLLTYVVATGVMYGEGEDILHWLFKDAWHNASHLRCIGSGKNMLPMIHVRDAANVLLEVAATQPEERYVLAVDEGQFTQLEIVQGLTRWLGTGGITHISPNDALLIDGIDVRGLQLLTVNLRMEGTLASEMGFDWICREGFASHEGLSLVTEEYRAKRHIQPLKVALAGPPAAGKTHYAKRLCAEYHLHLVNVHDCVQKAAQGRSVFAEDVRAALRGDQEETDDYQPREREKDRRKSDKSSMPQLKEEKAEKARPRLPDDLLCRAVKKELASNACRNQGYVLDGFPKTADQAALLFGEGEEGDDDEGDFEGSDIDEGVAMPIKPTGPQLKPEFLIVLDAPDAFLKHRIMALPESATKGTHNTEVGLARRLRKYRERNAESLDETAVTWMEEHEVFALHVDVDTLDQVKRHEVDKKDQAEKARKAAAAADPLENLEEKLNAMVVMPGDDEVDPDWDPLFDKMKVHIGQPRNYGPSEEEVLAKKELAENKKAEFEKERTRIRTELESQAAAEDQRKRMEEEERAEAIAHEEREMLETASMPLRGYLMSNVVPVLTEAMIEVARVRPEDPIDFLAEFLFRHNPQNTEVDA